MTLSEHDTTFIATPSGVPTAPGNAVEVHEAALTAEMLEATHLSLWEAFRRSVRRWADRPAVTMSGDEWTYQELHDRSLRAAAALASMGVTRGTRVAFLINGCPEWPVLHYALARIGAVGVPINLVDEHTEVRHVLAWARPEVLIAIDSFRGVDYEARLAAVDPGLRHGSASAKSLPSIRHVVVVPLDERERPQEDDPATRAVFGGPDDPQLDPVSPVTSGEPAYIVFTSGSTARPKAALCAHRGLVGSGLGMARALEMGPEDRLLAVLPPFHVGGIANMLVAPHSSGACTVLLGAFDASRALEVIERERCTVTIGFDTMFTKMTAAPNYSEVDRSSLKKVAIAATPAYLGRLRDEWGLRIAAGIYGSTESGALISVVRPWMDDTSAKRESNGRPLPGVDVVIRDPETGETCAADVPGEICFRGWNRVLEYCDDPEATSAAIDDDGYFHSGDYGYLDADGNLYYRGRYKMMIKTGGENVSEREVEVFLENEIAPIELAQVVGVPDDTWGEAVVAFVQLSDDVSSDELREMARGKIAKFKIPKRFYPLKGDEFPTLANGRPDKKALRVLALERHRS